MKVAEAVDFHEITGADTVLDELKQKFGSEIFVREPTRDGVPTVWIPPDRAHAVLDFLKNEIPRPYPFLYDLTGIDERNHTNRADGLDHDFTVVYQLLSFERNTDVRLKIPLDGQAPSVRTITDIWPMANWYERELWDMFGINVEGHPDLRRILTPPWWEGHALRKDHPARATDIGRFELPEDKQKKEEEALRFEPEKWGLKRRGEDTDFMFLNVGPQHTGTHGVLRLVLQLDGEEILDCVPDIGYHHRAKEKMAERQSWHTFIPYTDRVDYLAGVLNNLAYCLSVERLAGIEVPDRVKVIRVMLSELFRISNHLVWYGTFAQDVGQLSPVFYMFTDRERVLEIIEAVCGGRMHPSWFRIGGVAQDLPEGWDDMIRRYVEYQRKRLDEYDGMVMQNRIFKARTKGVGDHDTETAIEWGVTGPNLRATGFEWDFRKKRPYSGYDQFRFDVPTATHGDCYDRAVVRVEEIRQSLRIIEQCVDNMPAGSYKSLHPLATPPLKERTMHDIETLIHHFLGVSWGPVIPAGEGSMAIESSKGYYGYYLISDGGTNSYRTRIRTPSFAHMQLVPVISRGFMVADLLAILGSIDFVMADVDR